MAILLQHRLDAVPAFEVLDASEQGRIITVRPLWGPPKYQSCPQFPAPKEELRGLGYRPVEVDDAIVT